MIEGDPAIQVGIWLLFVCQCDIASDGIASHLFGTAIGRFHDTWAAPRHDREPRLGDSSPDLSRQLVIGLIFGESGRTEDRHARADEVQRAKSLKQFPEDAGSSTQLESSRLRTAQKSSHFRLGGTNPPVRL